MSNKPNIKYVIETIVVAELNRSTGLVKNAGASENLDYVVSVVKEGVKSYVEQKIDPNDKLGSFVNLFGPAVITNTLGLIPGMGIVSKLIGLAMSYYHVDIWGAIKSIASKIQDMLLGGKGVTEKAIESLVGSELGSLVGSASPGVAKSSYISALDDLEIIKNSFDKNNQVKLAVRMDYSQINLLKMTISWLFKTAITAAGLNVASDVANKVTGRPNAFDKNLRETPESSPSDSQQHNFPLNPSYRDRKYTNWVENVTNNEFNISKMLIDFAKEVYSGLEGLDSQITSTPGFHAIRDMIVDYNEDAKGDPVVMIPKKFTSKKQIVDFFIDDVKK